MEQKPVARGPRGQAAPWLIGFHREPCQAASTGLHCVNPLPASFPMHLLMASNFVLLPLPSQRWPAVGDWERA